MSGDHLHDREPDAGAYPLRRPNSAADDAGLGTMAGNGAIAQLMSGANARGSDVLPTQGAGPLHDDIADVIDSARGQGSPLSTPVRVDMESHFGVDLASIRVHDDSAADALSRSVQAIAFTTGRDIFFSRGAYDPAGKAGRELLAHEITHTIQQSAAPSVGSAGVSRADDPAEIEAEQIAQEIAYGSNSSTEWGEPV